MPQIDARRIAAQCSGRLSYMPQWLPRGFVFSRWAVASRLAACDEGPIVHFTRGSIDLRWRASDSTVRGTPPCRDRRFSVGITNGRRIFHRSTGGIETVWACIDVGFPMTISVAQRAVPDGAAAHDLERMVATAGRLPPGRAPGSGYELPSAAQVVRIVAAFGSPLFLPARLPAGAIFSQWKVVPRDSDFDGRRSLSVTFGRDGPVVEWRVLSGVEKYAIDCPGKHSEFTPPRPTVVDGHPVFFLVGIHGASAWRCIPRDAVGNAKPLEVELWYDIRLDRRAMRRQARLIVADASLIR